MASIWRRLRRSAPAVFSSQVDLARGILRAAARSTVDLPGCPICRLVRDGTQRNLSAILWEQVTDPETHARLLRSRGFCFEHSWALVPASDQAYSWHGLTVLQHAVLRDLLRSIESNGVAGAKRWLAPAAPCPQCVETQHIVATYAPEMASLYAADLSLLSERPALLCRPHLAFVWRYLPFSARDNFWNRVALRQEELMTRGSPAARLETEVGERPVHMPEAAESCPACFAERARLHIAPAFSTDRLTAWMQLLDAADERAWVSEPSHNGHQVWEGVRQMGGMDDASLVVMAVSAGPTDSASLCLGHLRRALSATSGRDATEILFAAEEGLERLESQLTRFEASADYGFRDTLTLEERRSWREAIARVAGERPGVDLHAQSHDSRNGEWRWGRGLLQWLG